jgi:hypothetical protein
VQEALSVIQFAITLITVDCVPGAGQGFACDGALVYGVGASTIGLFAGLVFDQNISQDILAMAVSMFGVIPGAGFPLGMLADLFSLYSNANSLLSSCLH